MPRRTTQLCKQPGCPRPATLEGTCALHWRGNATTRGYGSAHRRRFRTAVLARDPICVWPGCSASSTEADHHPLSRWQLVTLGLDPDDPEHGRGLCGTHHRLTTAQRQRG